MAMKRAKDTQDNLVLDLEESHHCSSGQLISHAEVQQKAHWELVFTPASQGVSFDE